MKNKIKIYLLGSLLLTMTSCYDSFLDYDGNTSVINTDDGTSSSTGTLANASLAVEFLRGVQPIVVSSKVHRYQYQYSFVADDYAGYMSCPHNFDGRLKSTLAFYAPFAGGANEVLNLVAQQTIPVIRSVKKLEIAPLGAMASILFSDAALRYTNAHGPMPLSDYKSLKEQHPLNYEKQSEVYTQLFKDLIAADVVLKSYQTNPTDELNHLIKQADAISEESDPVKIITCWRKYANSLILRMAMTISDVDAYQCEIDGVAKTAQQLAEEAVQRGVFDDTDKGMGLKPGSALFGSNLHPLYIIANGWTDARLNASYHNYLLRTQHPILDLWFCKNYADVKNSQGQIKAKNSSYMSMRTGTRLVSPALCSKTYLYYSRFNLIFSAEKMYLFKAEESLFLKSEGALRGWNMGGSAKDYYASGVSLFLKNHNFTNADITKYLSWKGMGNPSVTAELKEQATYKDWIDPDNDLPKYGGYYQLNNAFDAEITNPYCKQGDKQQMLQKIITQKWIALFPMSLVAWTDYRRTGYPKLLPYAPFAYGYSDGTVEEPRYNWLTGGLVSEGVTARRIPYPTNDSEIAEEVNLSAVEALNTETTGQKAGDKQGTRLWWDITPKKKIQ